MKNSSLRRLLDTAVFAEMVYIKEPLMWRLISNVQGTLQHLTHMTLVPKEGSNFKFRNIVNHGIKTRV
jgi:hypothetical protein